MIPYFDNKEFLEKQYDLTPEDILNFLSFPHIQAQEISLEKNAWYCKFGNSNEITPNGFPRFFLLGKLIREHFLLADMRDYKCTFREETKEFKEFMEWARMKDKHFILPWLKKEYNTLHLFSADIGFHHFMSLLDAWDDFDMQIRTAPYFISSFFQFLNSYTFKEAINENLVNTGLYKDIIDHTGGKRNSRDSIILQYDLEDYVFKKRIIHKTLSKLEDSKNLKIQDTIINEFTVSFVLSSFVDFEASLFGIEQTEDRVEEIKVAQENLAEEKVISTWTVVNTDTGEIFHNENLIDTLKMNTNSFRFMEILFLNKWKHVSYTDIKNHVKRWKTTSDTDEYCQKIKNELPENIKALIHVTGWWYRIE